MSYQPNIPQATDPILQSQGQLRPNFQEINIAFSQNHVGINEDLRGMHNVLTMRPQTTAPVDPTTSATQIALYNKLVSTLPNLFYRPNNSQTPIQLTYPSINTTQSSDDQYSFVAGPFVVYMGKKVNATDGQVVIFLPATNLIYVGLTVANLKNATSTINAIPTNIVANSFTITFGTFPGPPILDIYYLAIGL